MIRVEFDPAEWLEAERVIQEIPKTELRDVAVRSYEEIAVTATPEELMKLELTYSGRTATVTATEGAVTVPSDIPIPLRLARQLALETGRAPELRLQRPLAPPMPRRV